MILDLRRMVTSFAALSMVFVLFNQTGCQPASDGPIRYELSGQATFAGKPIPFGRILLQPDTERGNQGPAGIADINDGQFHTRTGKGHVGGPHLVKIIATDGTRPASADVDNSLFPPFSFSIDLPAENATNDFSVPDKADKADEKSTP